MASKHTLILVFLCCVDHRTIYCYIGWRSLSGHFTKLLLRTSYRNSLSDYIVFGEKQFVYANICIVIIIGMFYLLEFHVGKKLFPKQNDYFACYTQLLNIEMKYAIKHNIYFLSLFNLQFLLYHSIPLPIIP